jgi:hypothetical protein
MAETRYDGLAHGAVFYLPTAGIVWFGFGDPRATSYVRSPGGSVARVQPGVRLSLSAGQHTLKLYEPQLLICVAIVHMPDYLARGG